MSEQKPSVGRIVHYYYSFAQGEGPIAAIVTGVRDDGSCDLTLFHPNALLHDTIRKEAVPFAPEPTPLHWNWPPRV